MKRQDVVRDANVHVSQRAFESAPDRGGQWGQVFWNESMRQFLIDLDHGRVVRVNDWNRLNRHAGIEWRAAARDDLDRIAVIRKQSRVRGERRFHTADDRRRGIVQDGDAWSIPVHRFSPCAAPLYSIFVRDAVRPGLAE